jgi:hypothetical protein
MIMMDKKKCLIILIMRIRPSGWVMSAMVRDDNRAGLQEGEEYPTGVRFGSKINRPVA